MKIIVFFAVAAGIAAAAPSPSLISVRLTMQSDVFVSGEGYTGYVNVDNSSADDIDVGNPGSPDRLFVELFRDVTERVSECYLCLGLGKSEASVRSSSDAFLKFRHVRITQIQLDCHSICNRFVL